MKKKSFLYFLTIILTLSIGVWSKNIGFAATLNYQNTPAYSNPGGKINLDLYDQQQLTQLTQIVAGDGKYTGNTSLSNVASDHVYNLSTTPYPNFVGSDGVFELYDASDFMNDSQVQAAADYWNRLAGKEIVKIVTDPALSDEVIHDVSGDTGSLGGQTYDGHGLEFHPDSFKPQYFAGSDFNMEKVAVLIHEIGHGMGITHLGGGENGDRSGNEGVPSADFMSFFVVSQHPEGIKSTQLDAADLALAALTWKGPQKLADWILTSPTASVTYLPIGENISSIPKGSGVEIDFSGNYMNKVFVANTSATVRNNYNVYTFSSGSDTSLTLSGTGHVDLVGTTQSLGMLSKTLTVSKIYTTKYTANYGYMYYEVLFNGKYYVIHSSAFDQQLKKTGISIDSPNNYLTNTQSTNQAVTIKQNYNLYTLSDRDLQDTYIDSATFVGTTQGAQLIGQTVTITTIYTSQNSTYYGFYDSKGNYYVINALATN